jgi:hypothetical protein
MLSLSKRAFMSTSAHPMRRDPFNSLRGEENSNGRTEVQMLNLYAVKVRRTGEPGYCEITEIRTYSARRAQRLANDDHLGAWGEERNSTPAR